MQKVKVKPCSLLNCYYHMWTLEEIAHITGVPASTLRTKIKKLDLPDTRYMQRITIDVEEDHTFYFGNTTAGVLNAYVKKLGKTWIFMV